MSNAATRSRFFIGWAQPRDHQLAVDVPETSSRSVHRTVCGLSVPAFWLMDVATTSTVSMRDTIPGQFGLFTFDRIAVRPGRRW